MLCKIPKPFRRSKFHNINHISQHNTLNHSFSYRSTHPHEHTGCTHTGKHTLTLYLHSQCHIDQTKVYTNIPLAVFRGKRTISSLFNTFMMLRIQCVRAMINHRISNPLFFICTLHITEPFAFSVIPTTHIKDPLFVFSTLLPASSACFFSLHRSSL